MPPQRPVTAPSLPPRTQVSANALLAFSNRLHKNFRHWSRWARRRDLGAFRFYDRDLPEFPFAIDVYVPVDLPGLRVHVAEVDTGWVQEPAEHAAWLEAVTATIATTVREPPSRIVMKRRARRRGGAQHVATGRRGAPFMVLENGLRFWVDLESYVDTGLFLDHRAMRAIVRSRVAGRRVLNLFAYTGSFTVYAAAGGAVATDTVDLSNVYLAWAERNFRANGLDLAAHRLVRSDVLRWLDDARERRERYDLVVLDPPAFSNSKAMTHILDVQRDHRALIEACLELLGDGGELYFSTNLRSFTLDPALESRGRDIGAETRAEDFRDPRVHHAFRFVVSR
ncbi:MAG: class I SAM-dependent methyltransferase [Casimicrobiaceae bacterium]